MKKLLIMAAGLMLSGCASFNQGVAAYGASAVTNARVVNDNVIAGWTVLACATPVSAALRNPQIIPALKVLCLPAGDLSPAALLDPAARAGRE